MVTKFFNYQLRKVKVTLKSLKPEGSHDWATKNQNHSKVWFKVQLVELSGSVY